MKTKTFQNHVIIVTGASSGIGKALSLQLADEGARLSLAARNTERLDIPEMRAMFPQVEVKAETRWVDTGMIVSSAGISAGIDMSLHLVERLVSKELAVSTARQMEFDWQNSGLSLC